MTIINGIEIDDITYQINDIKLAILNNDPIEEKLNVIIVVSNPCLFARRYILAREFIKRVEQETIGQEDNNIRLFVVELTYGDQEYYVTKLNNKNHLRLRGDIPLWHKENMINIGVKKLLPKDWKAFAWIDADIEFDSPSWALDTLKLLNGSKDVVQLFSHAIDMDKDQNAMNIFPSFCYQFSNKKKYGGSGVNQWHPGFAWACTRKAYERMDGLYEHSILGSGDHNMSLSFIGNGLSSINENTTDGYKLSIQEFENKCKNFRLGYVPGVIKHYFHGSKKNRKYGDRWKLLVKYNYNPFNHIRKDSNGLLIPTSDCPQELLDEIMKYFLERNEDEFF
jgi:hypothetical protein